MKLSLQGATLSTNESVYYNWVINRTIDGITGRAEECNCCTAIKRPTWLLINLPQTYFVKRVVLQGRTDTAGYYQFRNITIFGVNADNHMVEQRVTTFSDTIQTYELSPPQAMQAIRVVGQQVPDYMTICEIEVYRQEDCIIGTYGPNCEQRCYCLNGPCDTLTGTCGTGCQSGWRGAACNTTCDNGWYGRDCLSRCGNCLNNTACNKTSGMCPDGCAAGYKGSLCKDACDNGWYGRDCLSRCGNCLNNTACNKISGMCPDGCAAGYKGSLCKYECENGLHGLGCQNMCGNCQNKVPCNKVSGVCPGECEPGFKRTMCTDECENHWYGLRCQNSCGNCKNKGACNKVSGVCQGGCAPGYNGTMCTDECENDWYGPGCETRCGNCRNKVPCDKISGVCPGDCEPGYYGMMCIDAAKEKTTIELSHEVLVGVILAAIATGAVCSIVAVLCLRHRRRQTSSSNNMERCQRTTVPAYDALLPTTEATSHFDTLTMTIPPTSSDCEQTALKKVEENGRLQLNQKTVAVTYENLSPNLTTEEEQYEQFENS